MSVLCEVRGLLAHQLDISNDRIAALFETWHKSGPLRGNYLVGIGSKALRFKEGDGIKDERGIVEGIEDKVTQDADYSEVRTIFETFADIAGLRNMVGRGTQLAYC